MANTASCHDSLQEEECSRRNLKMMFGVNAAFSLAYANSMAGQCSRDQVELEIGGVQ